MKSAPALTLEVWPPSINTSNESPVWLGSGCCERTFGHTSMYSQQSGAADEICVGLYAYGPCLRKAFLNTHTRARRCHCTLMGLIMFIGPEPYVYDCRTQYRKSFPTRHLAKWMTVADCQHAGNIMNSSFGTISKHVLTYTGQGTRDHSMPNRSWTIL